MNIGDVAAASGVSAKMVRYYEAIGLIGPAARNVANYRVYAESDVHTLRFIRRARSLGFSVEEMAALLQLWRNRRRASADVKRLALRHVSDLEARITELHQMAETLRHLARTCHGDSRPDCPILEQLAQADVMAPRPGKPRLARTALSRRQAGAPQARVGV